MIQPADPDLPRLPSFVLAALVVGTLVGWLAWRLWRSWSSAVRLATAAAALVDRIAEARATAVATGETVMLEAPRHGDRLANGVRWDVLCGDGPTGYGTDNTAAVTRRVDFRPDGSATAESVRLCVDGRRLVIPLRSNAATTQ